MEIRPKFKLWLENEDGTFVIGEGMCKLLENIENTGSLSEAAKKSEISYAHAWKKIRKMEAHFGATIVEKTRGGTGGGSSLLSQKGKDLLEKYKKIEKKIENTISSF